MSDPSAMTIPTIDDLIELPEIFDPQISPDGRWVAYIIRQPDWKQNEYQNRIWLASTDQSSAPKALTSSKSSCGSPRWSPDGKWLAFLARRNSDSGQQIYRLSITGGEAERITEIEKGVQNFAWSPSGKQIAFTAAGAENEVLKQRKEKFGDYAVIDQDYTRLQAWVIDAASSLEKPGDSLPKARQLTTLSDGHVQTVRWRPGQENEHELALEVWPSPDIADADQSRIALLNTHDLQVTYLTGSGCSAPEWSPDGNSLAYIQAGTPSFYANEKLIVLTFGQEPRMVLPDFDENPALAGWAGNGLYFSAIQKTAVHLFHLDPANLAYRMVTPPDISGWVLSEVSLTSDGAWAAVTAYHQNAYKELYLLETGSGIITPLTNLTGRTRTWHLGAAEVIEWQSTDGAAIQGVLTKPADFDPEYCYPLLVVLHGGPTGISSPILLSNYERRYYPFQLWVAKGALVLQVNYRGSAGYGEAFRSLNVRNLGVGDYWDVISGVDHLINQGFVDPDRLGVMGWSQGGYISAFIATYSKRFKAVSVGAGISNWVTYYVNTDIHPFTRQYLHATPWDDAEVYAKTSPITYINQAQTPALIQHGEFDARVPTPNAYELYQGLKDRGVETKLVIYKGMGHAITRPRLNRQVMEENFAWFNRWLWDEKPDGSPSTTCYFVHGSVEKATVEGDIPAIQRYTAERILEARLWARRDQADFRILSSRFGMLAEESPIPWYDHTLLPEAIPALARQTADKLKTSGWKKLVLFTGDPAKDPGVLNYLGWLYIAAGIAGGIGVEHRIITDKGW